MKWISQNTDLNKTLDAMMGYTPKPERPKYPRPKPNPEWKAKWEKWAQEQHEKLWEEMKKL